MEEKEFLVQQIEFLEFQLEDAKTREVQTKAMYESMLSSLSSDNQLKDSEAKIIQMQNDHQTQIQSINTSYKEKTKILETNISYLENQIQELTDLNYSSNMVHERKFQYLEEEISSKVQIITELASKIIEYETLLEQKDKKIASASRDMDELSEKHNEDFIKALGEENKKLEELKNIYETEKLSLKNIIVTLESERKSSSISDYLDSLTNETDQSTNKTASTHKYIEKILEECRESIKSIPKDMKNQLKQIITLPLKERLDLTEKMLKHSTIIQEKFVAIKNSLGSLKKFMLSKEDREKFYKEILEKKNEEIENLQRAISIKACDQTKAQNCNLIETLITKDTEIIRLKKIIGELRGKDVNKPPTHSIKHTRSKTMPSLTSPFKIQSRSSITQLDLTVISNIELGEKCEGCVVYTTASSERNSEEKFEIFEKKISALKMALLKLKNQRDRAKNVSEKLLLELKQKKLDLAMLQESFAEQKFSLTSQLKSFSSYATSLTASPLIPKIIKQDLQKFLSLYSQC